MSRHMIAAEVFQESIDGPACVYVLHLHEGYFVPYRTADDLIRVRVFTATDTKDCAAPDFYSAYPASASDHTIESIEEGAPSRRSSFVYFISDGEHVKIGLSRQPRKRLSSLQTGHPKRLNIVGLMPGGAEDEFQLHGRFRDHRVKGEWFRDCSEIRDFIALAANDNSAIARAA
ncbi:mRNA-degrading endonuclease YafQ of YafQ-DinJ toxin-antitoxin module [Shinella sp. BE166]|uniref:GIY-YIG nuclease family protein n=1 Tax=Shinella sp. BE166 TaxID=3373918 RepID=UPI003EC1110F